MLLAYYGEVWTWFSFSYGSIAGESMCIFFKNIIGYLTTTAAAAAAAALHHSWQCAPLLPVQVNHIMLLAYYGEVWTRFSFSYGSIAGESLYIFFIMLLPLSNSCSSSFTSFLTTRSTLLPVQIHWWDKKGSYRDPDLLPTYYSTEWATRVYTSGKR
jgi:hypothetical protein